MAKTLKVSASIAVPDDVMEQAELLSAVKPALEAFEAAIGAHGGTITTDLVALRGPKKAKG